MSWECGAMVFADTLESGTFASEAFCWLLELTIYPLLNESPSTFDALTKFRCSIKFTDLLS